jgi:hypothetical protein
MNDDLGTTDPHPHIALLLRQYARDLGQLAPSSDLDARIGALVAAGPQKIERKKSAALSIRRRPGRALPYAAAAGMAALAISLGILIGMKLERAGKLAAANQGTAREAGWSSADLTMWPSDSVSFKIPAEYSPQGTLVAVDPDTQNTSTRYWIDVVVSNDGTFRIERIVPADPKQKPGGHDGVAPHVQ